MSAKISDNARFFIQNSLISFVRGHFPVELMELEIEVAQFCPFIRDLRPAFIWLQVSPVMQGFFYFVSCILVILAIKRFPFDLRFETLHSKTDTFKIAGVYPEFFCNRGIIFWHFCY